ncbi:MAG: hypothetical protein FJX47_00250 [Alphaproteobacteria bacterium]|nr:hypothetical protein [Alphaproteobacteria bacterium]
MTGTTHETFTRTDEAAKKGSTNRAFGLVMAVFFAIIGAWPLLDGEGPRLWSLGIAALFVLAAFAAPRALAPLNKAWTGLGLFLHKITNPIFLGAIYFVAVVPTGLIMRALGKDILRLKIDRAAKSYWIPRDPPGPSPETMPRQF